MRPKTPDRVCVSCNRKERKKLKKKTKKLEEEIVDKKEQKLSEEVIEMEVSDSEESQNRDARDIMKIKDEEILGEVFTKRMVSDFSIGEFSSSEFGCIKKVSKITFLIVG